MRDKAGLWQRVSTGGQDEASQLPDLTRWCESHDYDIAKRYVLHGKSASKGQQDKHIDEAIRDMQDGTITVLVVWQSSRIERRGAYSVFDLARRVLAAGGRIEYVKDAYLNDVNEMSDVMLALAATKDRQKSRDISLQVTAKQAALRAAGSVVGRVPWGYVIVKQADGRKILVPTSDGRKYIPLIFQMVIDGKPVRDIAAWLDSEHVSTESGKSWHEGYLSNRLIKNPVYYGERRNAGQLKTEALVSYSVWQEANAALASRARPGRGTVKRDKALLSPVCGNPRCHEIRQALADDEAKANAKAQDKPVKRVIIPDGDSPMYRVQCGKERSDYYRCTGRGPQRKGCGNMVRCAELDAIVIDMMLEDDRPHFERVFVPGDDRSDDIGKLREQAMDAYRKGDKALFAELDAQAEALASLPSIAPHWVDKPAGQTEGDYFAGLGEDARRVELQSQAVFVGSHVTNGARPVVIGPKALLPV